MGVDIKITGGWQPPSFGHNREVADSRTAGILYGIDTACFHCDSLNYETQFNKSKWKHAVSRIKKPAVRESATSLLMFQKVRQV